MSFPKDFLTEIAHEKELTEKETEVFLSLFGDGKSRVQIAIALHIGESVVSTRLSGVYKKFQIDASGPVKESRLKDYLTDRYRRWKSADLGNSSVVSDVEQDIDALVQEVRSRAYPDIKKRTGTMQMLRVEKPVPVTDIYVDLNILKRLSSHISFSNWHKDSELDWRSFDRLGVGRVEQERVPAIEKIRDCHKLMVLGKPGAGKSTLLKAVATACIEERLAWDEPQTVPVFITLREFAEDAEEKDVSLRNTIQQQFNRWGVAEAAEPILKQGKTMILLDGLDEVPTRQSEFVVRQMRCLCRDYGDNRFIITCRTQSLQLRFEDFTEVEIADFTPEQVARFIQNWFSVVVGNAQAAEFAEQLIQQLQKNEPIAELAVTPILLNLTCSVFRDERGKLPTKRTDLYSKGLRDLLERWDQSRGIRRDDGCRPLSLDEKENLLAHVAYILFEDNDYFPEQCKLERLIANHLQIQRSKAEHVLRSLEAQHGLIIERSEGYFSFSHLTFHEYFTARKIVTSCNPYAADDPTLQGLVSHITEKCWREVFFLTVGMLDSADALLKLMKAQIDGMLVRNEGLQEFLEWLAQKAHLLNFSYSKSAIRTLYFSLIIGEPAQLDLDLAYTLGINLDFNFFPNQPSEDDKLISEFAVDRNLRLAFLLASDTGECQDLLRGGLRIYLDQIIANELSDIYPKNSDLENAIQSLINKLPSCWMQRGVVDGLIFYQMNQWWQANGQAWTEQLRSAMIEHRHIGHDWQFSDAQKERLQQYYDANKLLVDCLNSDCNTSSEVRQEIEETLLLPIAEIKKRRGL